MRKVIAVIPGDGIGPEITFEAQKALAAVGARFGHDFEATVYPVGGAAYDLCGDCLPDTTLAACRAADAVLLGAVGGPKWDALPAERRPERRALLTLRAELGLFGNLRPAKVWPALRHASPLKPEIVEGGIDVLVVRELTGGIYFGAHERAADGQSARDVMPYSVAEIERIARDDSLRRADAAPFLRADGGSRRRGDGGRARPRARRPHAGHRRAGRAGGLDVRHGRHRRGGDRTQVEDK